MTNRLKVGFSADSYFSKIFVCTCLVLWLYSSSLSAQESSILVSPTNISINLKKQCILCNKSESIEVELMLLAAGNTVKPNIIVNQLTRTTEDHFPLPPDAVTILEKPTPAEVVPGIPSTVELIFHMDKMKNTHSGEYTGAIYVNHDDSTINVPVSLKLKDDFALPLLVLLASLLISVYLSKYRTKGLRRDEITVAIHDLEIAVNQEAELPDSFREVLEQGITRVRHLVNALNLQAANAAIESAHGQWQKWVFEKENWLTGFNHAESLESSIKNIKTQSEMDIKFSDELEHKLHITRKEAPTKDSALVFKDELELIENDVERFAVLAERVRGLQQIFKKINLEEDKQRFTVALNQLIQSISIQDEEDQYLADLDELVNNVEDNIKSNSMGSQEAIDESNFTEDIWNRGSIIDFDKFNYDINAQTNSRSNYKNAKRNIKLFLWVSYVVALLLLLAVGFNELYISQPIFGTFGDYMKLIAFGFGAEFSRAQIVKRVSTWKLHGLEEIGTSP